MAKSKKVALGVVGSLIAALAIASGVYAYATSHNVNVAGDYNFYEAVAPSSPEDAGLGATSGTYVAVTDIEFVDGGMSKGLNFSAAATTTAGGLVRLLNAGTAKVCRTVEIDISDGTGTGGATGAGNALAFSLSTSTTPTAFSTASGSGA